MLWNLRLHSLASAVATSHTLFVYAGTKPLGTNAASPNNFGHFELWKRCKVKFTTLLPTLHFSVDRVVAGFNLARARCHRRIQCARSLL